MIVVDDNSDYDSFKKNQKICEENNINFIYNHERKGIAATKNICASYLNTEYIFLFDDDCYPRKSGWDQVFIDATKRTGVKHFSYTRELITPGLTGNVVHTEELTSEEGVSVFSQCFGVCNYFTKDCFDALGGFDENFGMYGYEHAELSQRAWDQGFCGKQRGYYSPTLAKEYLYSLDVDYGWLHEKTDLGDPPFEFKSSTSDEDMKKHIKIAETQFKKLRKF